VVSAGPKAVLVVDDEPLIRGLLAAALRRRGIPVLQAGDGVQALEVYQTHAARIGLVLMDVRMPRLSGPEALVALRALDPGLVCCLMSGHAGDYGGVELGSLGAEAVFTKPFNLNEVLPLIQRLLARALCPCDGASPAP